MSVPCCFRAPSVEGVSHGILNSPYRERVLRSTGVRRKFAKKLICPHSIRYCMAARPLGPNFNVEEEQQHNVISNCIRHEPGNRGRRGQTPAKVQERIDSKVLLNSFRQQCLCTTGRLWTTQDDLDLFPSGLYVAHTRSILSFFFFFFQLGPRSS